MNGRGGTRESSSFSPFCPRVAAYYPKKSANCVMRCRALLRNFVWCLVAYLSLSYSRSETDMDYGTRHDFDCGLVFFLIPSASGYTYKNLPTAFGGAIYVPVISTSRFERDIKELYLFGRYGHEIAVSCKIFCVSSAGFTYWENRFLFEFLPCIRSFGVIFPDFDSLAKSRERVWK